MVSCHTNVRMFRLVQALMSFNFRIIVKVFHEPLFINDSDMENIERRITVRSRKRKCLR